MASKTFSGSHFIKVLNNPGVQGKLDFNCHGRKYVNRDLKRLLKAKALSLQVQQLKINAESARI